MKIKTVNVTNQVIEYMRENIENGEWKIGEKIPSENKLAEELGVSRSSIRASVQYYMGLGILKSHQGKGTFLVNNHLEDQDAIENRITADDCADLIKVLEFRLIMEPACSQLAAGNATTDSFEFLRADIRTMKDYRKDMGRFVKADIHFHEEISKMSGNSLLYKCLHKFFQETRGFYASLNVLFGDEMAIYYHQKILDAIASHDSQAAYNLMYQHINYELTNLQKD